MENDYRKYTIYDVLMTIGLTLGLVTYYYYGKLWFFLLAMLIILIMAFLQRRLVKSHGIDPTKLMELSTTIIFVVVFVIFTHLSNRYTWAIVGSVIVFVVMLYFLNKSFKEKLLANK